MWRGSSIVVLARDLPPPALLVVPGREWRETDLRRLHEWQACGAELVAHGWLHRTRPRRLYHRLHAAFFSRDVAEHLALPADGVLDLMRASHDWFAAHDLPSPQTYIPPAWALGVAPHGSSSCPTAVSKCCVAYCYATVTACAASLCPCSASKPTRPCVPWSCGSGMPSSADVPCAQRSRCAFRSTPRTTGCFCRMNWMPHSARTGTVCAMATWRPPEDDDRVRGRRRQHPAQLVRTYRKAL
jgi:hypothetical protein